MGGEEEDGGKILKQQLLADWGIMVSFFRGFSSC